MKKHIVFVVALLFSSIICAQQNDAVWLLGYGFNTENNGGTKLIFNNNSIDTFRFQLPFWLDGTPSVISDNEGELATYTNGNLVSNRVHEIMPNGYDINPGKVADSYCIEGRGYPAQSGATLILPKFDGQNFYRLFHLSYRDSTYERFEFLYSDIDMNLYDGLGDVTTKNELILIDTFLEELSATKHANGRDWWIVIPRRAGNGYYKYLYTPNGLSSPTIQNIGYQRDTYFYWVSQAEFSPDGTKYARANFYNGLDIMNFDRCTGEFSNALHIAPTHELYGVGLSFSPNSRFLYYSTLDSLHQYDLWASDIPNSRVTVAVYTGEIDPFASFYFQKLAPNGKILMSANNSSKYIHIVHHPDLKGDSCQFQETGLRIPFYNGWYLPNFQHYRLGPVDGSVCDSLGIDNVPVAKFRYEDDTLNMFHFDFWDLSYYEPQQWLWTFGDGGTSSLRNPTYTYAQEGVYQVCLTVSNSNGSHTFCRELVVGSSSTWEQQEEAQMVLFPNPAQDKVYINWVHRKLPYQVVIHDMLGRVVLQARWSEVEKGISMGQLPLGTYILLVQDERGRVLGRGKMVKGK